MRRGFAVMFAVVMILSACTGGEPKPKASGGESQVPRGGTLRVSVQDQSLTYFGTQPLDPQRAYWGFAFELYRCCLLRTLLSYNGRPTAQGGARLFPDLAEAMPAVSADGLAWTFHLKPGLRYGPPLEDTPIVAEDVIRALKRAALLPPEDAYGFYYSIIQGFDDYGTGSVDSITGLQAPDDRTLIVRLTEPASDLGYRLSLPAAAPIPPLPGSSALGTATGHKDYSRFLVSSGPYMFEGSEDLDFSVPPDEQEPVAGYVPHRSVTLVRNTSWSPSTDALRGAFVDRIEFLVRPSPTSQDKDWAKVESGRLDLIFDASPPPGVVAAYRADPSLAERLVSNPDNFVAAININLAVPPFDDLHVRRALNWALDKAELVRLVSTEPTPLFGNLYGDVAGHLVPDSLEDNLLLGQDLYPTPGSAGSDARAEQEMARSRYDRDHDGVCDASVCKGILAVTQQGPFPAMAAEIERDLKPIGITLRVRSVNIFEMFGLLHTHRAHVPLGLGSGWAADFPAASQSFTGVFTPGSGRNDSNIGNAPEDLRTWGYTVTEVPSVDDQIDQCLALSSGTDANCWAQLDQYMMREVLPWAPYVFFTQYRTVSARVTRFSFDQFQGTPALDQIALAPGSD